MPFPPVMTADYRERFGNRLSLPEYRQIELYARKKRVPFDEDSGDAPPAVDGLLGLHVAFALLDAHYESLDPAHEGKTTWERYRALPRRTMGEKLAAEVFRILRIVRLAGLHASGEITVEDGLVKLFCIYPKDVIRLNVTSLGLDLLRSFVAYYLDSFRQPYGDAYTEAMLMEYYLDIVDEIKVFADEDRALFQFRRKYLFSRTLRLDCDSPRFSISDGRIHFDIPESLGNKARHPIDIFVMIDDCLHIIPVEALDGFSLPLAELPKWEARTGDALPSRFQTRFGRLIQVPGQPMS